MSVVRWFFGRSKMSRADLLAFIVWVSVFSLEQWWIALPVIFVWNVLATLIEMALFGEGYHKLSDDAQYFAEHSK